jgi:hypothetical protein
VAPVMVVTEAAAWSISLLAFQALPGSAEAQTRGGSLRRFRGCRRCTGSPELLAGKPLAYVLTVEDGAVVVVHQKLRIKI